MSWLSKAFKSVGVGNIISGAGALLGWDSAQKDRKAQREMAQNSIQWRVADAKAAGVHPLYALGAPTMNFQSVGDGGAGATLAQMGQDVSRAKMAAMDRREREAAATRAAIDAAHERQQNDVLFGQQVRRNELDMQYVQSQIARLNSAQIGPPNPGGISNPNPRVQPRPSSPVIGASGNPAREPGDITDYRYFRMPNGHIGIAPSEDWSGTIDDVTNPQTLGWTWRNNIVPFFDRGYFPLPNPRQYPLPPGADRWYWNGMTFEPHYPSRDPDVTRRDGSRRPIY